MSDEHFYEDLKEAIKEAETAPPKVKPDRKPLYLIFGLIVLLIFVLSAIPYYSVNVNPPPDFSKVESFQLTDAEKTRLENLTGGARGISQAIQLVNVNDYRTITNRLVTEACSTTSNLCFAKAIYHLVQSQTTYVSDPKIQYVQSPAETLLSGAGDCEDKSLLVAAMLESIGIDADIGVTDDHAFVRAQLPQAPFWLRHGEYVWLDPSSTKKFSQISFNAKEVIKFYEVA